MMHCLMMASSCSNRQGIVISVRYRKGGGGICTRVVANSSNLASQSLDDFGFNPVDNLGLFCRSLGLKQATPSNTFVS
jgi:hypothetical protein